MTRYTDDMRNMSNRNKAGLSVDASHHLWTTNIATERYRDMTRKGTTTWAEQVGLNQLGSSLWTNCITPTSKFEAGFSLDL